MPTAQMEAVASGVPDIDDLLFDAEAGSEDVQSRITRRLFGEDDGSDTPVSAFNSSI